MSAQNQPPENSNSVTNENPQPHQQPPTVTGTLPDLKGYDKEHRKAGIPMTVSSTLYNTPELYKLHYTVSDKAWAFYSKHHPDLTNPQLVVRSDDDGHEHIFLQAYAEGRAYKVFEANGEYMTWEKIFKCVLEVFEHPERYAEQLGV